MKHAPVLALLKVTGLALALFAGVGEAGAAETLARGSAAARPASSVSLSTALNDAHALASRKGYRLVVCEPAGANAFFLRHDVAPELARVPVAQAFRPAVSRLELGDAPLGEDPSLGADPRFPLVEV